VRWVHSLPACVLLHKPAWSERPGALRGSVFVLALVFAPSMMPVDKLAEASWRVAFRLGLVAAVFELGWHA